MTARSPRPWVWLALGLAVSPAGCGKKAATPPPAATPAPPPVSAGPPVTDAEAAEFGAALQAAVAAEEADRTTALLRLLPIFERSVADLPLPPAFRKGVLDGAAKSGGAGTLTAQLIAEVAKGGSYTRLRVVAVEGRPTVLMRLISAEGAINYHRLDLTRYPDGVGAADLYVWMSGEPVSLTFRRLLLAAGQEANRGLVDRLTGREQVSLKHMPDLTALGRHVREGRPAAALAVYRRLPAELQTDKAFLLLAILAASKELGDEYLVLLDRFRTTYPADPAVELVSIDYFYLKKDYAKAEAGLDRVDRAVGGDPYLTVLKAGVRSEAGRFADATAAVEEAIKAEPTLMNAYFAGVAVALRQKDHAGTLAWLKRAVEQGGATLDPGTMATEADYADFVRTPQFAELKKWYADHENK